MSYCLVPPRVPPGQLRILRSYTAFLLLPDFLSCNACYSCLPQRVRGSPEVSQAVVIAQCFLSDSIVRLFEQLHTAPYLVVVLVASRLGQLRGRCVKYLAMIKLTLPFDMIVRYSLALACPSQLTARI